MHHAGLTSRVARHGYVDGAVEIAATSTGEGTTTGIGTRAGINMGVREGTGAREGTVTGVIEGEGAGVCTGERAATASVGAMVDGSTNTSSGAGARLKIPVSIPEPYNSSVPVAGAKFCHTSTPPSPFQRYYLEPITPVVLAKRREENKTTPGVILSLSESAVIPRLKTR